MSSSVKNGVAVGYFGCNRFLMVLLSNTSGVNLCRECNYLMAKKPLKLMQILKFSRPCCLAKAGDFGHKKTAR
jgi:hypothetical protein